MLKVIFNRNINEIKQSKSLMFFGGFLALTHVFTCYRWYHEGSSLILNRLQDPFRICWPFFSDCEFFLIIPIPVWYALTLIYLILSLLCVLLFFSTKYVGLSWSLLLIISLLKACFFLSDYYFMGNYHYMAYIIIALYLFIYNKSKIISYTIFLFYLTAGTLKLNYEWLSGASTGVLTYFSTDVFEILLALTIILELIVSFGLLFKNRFIFYGSLASFAIFHIVSFYIVGSFYPLIMACLLSHFILNRIYPTSSLASKNSCSSWLFDDFRSFRKNKIHCLIIILFVSAQVFPRLRSGDLSLHGDGRLFSLNMFDSRSQCDYFVFARTKNILLDITHKYSFLGARGHCDPIVFWSYTNKLCRQMQKDKNFIDIDLYMNSKRTTATEYRNYIHSIGVCTKKLKYRIFQENNWIKKPKTSS